MVDVDREVLSSDEAVNLTVTVTTSGNIPSLAQPPLDGLVVVRGPVSARVWSTAGGRTSAQLVLEYRLEPTRTGKVTIGSIEITVDGETYRTDAITLDVTQAPARATPAQEPTEDAPAGARLTGQDFFVEAEVDNPTPYFGEQVVYIFRFYSAGSFFSLDQPRLLSPEFAGFWNKHESDLRRYQAGAAGRSYLVLELRTVLFPTITGPLTIEPATLTNRGSFSPRGQTLRTEPVPVEVRPLPPDAPGDFSGAVGRFSINAEIDSTSGRVNEPLILTVRISGYGNLDSLPDPIWPEIPRWRPFPQGATTETRVSEGRLVGSREYTRVLIPAAPGEFTIPPISYTYFDPAEEEYFMIMTKPIEVSIEPGSAEAPVAAIPGAAREGVQRLATDVRHIKPVPAVLQTADRPLTEQRLYWAAWTLPLLALAAGVGWKVVTRRREEDPALAQSLGARVFAMGVLAQARRGDADPYAVSGRVLERYLTDKLDRPVSGMTRDRLAAVLASRGIPPEVIRRAEACLVATEGGRFAPGGLTPSGDELLDETEAVIAEVEKGFES